MANETSGRFEKNPGFWWIVVVLVGLNLVYDYYHRLWLILDVIILIVLIAKWPRARKTS